MLIANPNHIASGIRGKAEDITQILNGRGLEKWFLKTICGFLATKAFGNSAVIPTHWVKALFDRDQWSETWAMYVIACTRTVTKQDAGFQIDFHWTPEQQLNGIVIRSFSIETLFTLVEPDRLPLGALKRPKLVGADIQRPDNGDVLEGLPRGEHIQFQITWTE